MSFQSSRCPVCGLLISAATAGGCLGHPDPVPLSLIQNLPSSVDADTVFQLLGSRNLALRSFSSFDRWTEFYTELGDLSYLRKKKARLKNWGEFKASFKNKIGDQPNTPPTLYIKNTSDFDTKQYTYMTPTSFSLVPAFGKITPFTAFSRNAGILVNVEGCKIKPHIYESESCTGCYFERSWDVKNIKFLEQKAREIMQQKIRVNPLLPPPSLEDILKKIIEQDDSNALESAKAYRSKQITLDILRERTAEDRTYNYNEILMSLQRSAIVGIYAYQCNKPLVKEVESHYRLASKIEALYHQQRLISDYNISVSVFLLDPEQGLSLYSVDQQRTEMQNLSINTRKEILGYLEDPIHSFVHKYLARQGSAPISAITPSPASAASAAATTPLPMVSATAAASVISSSPIVDVDIENMIKYLMKQALPVKIDLFSEGKIGLLYQDSTVFRAEEVLFKKGIRPLSGSPNKRKKHVNNRILLDPSQVDTIKRLTFPQLIKEVTFCSHLGEFKGDVLVGDNSLLYKLLSGNDEYECPLCMGEFIVKKQSGFFSKKIVVTMKPRPVPMLKP